MQDVDIVISGGRIIVMDEKDRKIEKGALAITDCS